MSTVLVFSESPIVLSAFELCLENAGIPGRIERAHTVTEVIETAISSAPEIIILDFVPKLHYSALTDIHRVAPGCRVILWTREISVEIAYESMRLGVRGILPHTLGAVEFRDAVTRIARGEVWLDSTLSASLLTLRPITLTPRETQLVSLLGQGLKNKEIATALNITEGSVKMYLSRLFQKLGVKDRYDLALFGLKNLGITQVNRTTHGTATLSASLRSVFFPRAS